MNSIQADGLLQQVNSTTTPAQKEVLAQQLAVYINELIQHDFEKLVQLLYRIDVKEQLLRTTLQEQTDTDAALIISHLIIQRQQEKLITRMNFNRRDDIPDEDKW